LGNWSGSGHYSVRNPECCLCAKPLKAPGEISSPAQRRPRLQVWDSARLRSAPHRATGHARIYLARGLVFSCRRVEALST
jgi:hypothetical protein